MNNIKEKILKKNKGLCNNFIEVYSNSDFTGCPRKVFYKRKFNKIDLEEKLFLNIDEKYQENEIEFNSEIWYQILSNVDGLKVSKSDLYFSDVKYNLHGRLNLVIKNENDLYGVNIYKISSDDYMRCKKEGSPFRKHVIENMMNIWMAEIKCGMIIYYCENDFEIFEIKPNRNIIKSVLKNITKINESLQIPDRPYDDANNSECKSCYFNKKCWNNQQKEIL